MMNWYPITYSIFKSVMFQIYNIAESMLQRRATCLTSGNSRETRGKLTHNEIVCNEKNDLLLSMLNLLLKMIPKKLEFKYLKLMLLQRSNLRV